MLCCSFSRVDDDYPWSTQSSRKSRRKDGKNPYSTRGLGKFSMVLAELESRRAKIIAQMGSQDVTLVRFGYSNSNDWVPIVVRIRDKKQGKAESTDKKHRPLKPKLDANDRSSTGASQDKEVAQPGTGSDGKMKKSFSWNVKECGVVSVGQINHDYWAIAVILSLLCLTLFGRVFAILCTSVWWYSVGPIKGRNVNVNGRKAVKEYGRRMTEKKLGVDVKSAKFKKMTRSHTK